jgi:CBS domain containing-hemolysin-like protein
MAEAEEGRGPFTTLQQDVSRFLTTILIGSTTTGIVATALVTDAAFKAFGEPGVGLATVALTIVMLVFCEIMPKSIAVVNAAGVARVVIPLVAMLSVILYPIGKMCKAATAVVLKLLKIEASDEPFVSESELKLVLSGAAKSGSLRDEENEMISSVLELEDTAVHEIMTPLVDVIALEESCTAAEVRELWVAHSHSRIPVYNDRVDNITGIMYVYDLLKVTTQGELDNVMVSEMCQRPPYFVPETMTAWNLLREFRIRNTHMAVSNSQSVCSIYISRARSDPHQRC